MTVDSSRVAMAQQRAFDWIDSTTNELTAFLSAYIQHKSINPKRALAIEPGCTLKCQQWLAEHLDALGCFGRVDLVRASDSEANVIVKLTTHGDESYRSLLFNGHSDVVPVTPEEYETWIGGNPWSGHVAAGNIFGRGASDMKGGNAAIIWALRALAELGIAPPGQVIGAFVVGEESGEAEVGPLNILENGCQADIAIVAEPTGMGVCPAAVGWFFARIDVQGEASHAAGRARSIYPSANGVVGINAIDIMQRLLSHLREAERRWGLWESHPLMTPGTMAINPVWVEGGAMQATTPAHCAAVIAVTVAPNRDCAYALQCIEATIRSACVGDPWLTAHPPKLTFPVLHRLFEPIDLSVEHPAVACLTRAVSDATSRPCPVTLMTTPSDANLLAEAGQPSIICGPGQLVGYGVHGLDERIPIREVVQAAKAYAAMALNWCSSPAENRGALA